MISVYSSVFVIAYSFDNGRAIIIYDHEKNVLIVHVHIIYSGIKQHSAGIEHRPFISGTNL